MIKKLQRHVSNDQAWFRIAALLVLVAALNSRSENAFIEINASQKGPDINPKLYGIFLEEINHGVDGGLYGEMIRNRGFEDSRPPEGYEFVNGRWQNRQGFDSGFTRYGYTTNGIPFWTLVRSGEAQGSMHLETTGGITKESAYCLRLDVNSATDGVIGVANVGFFGIGVRQGERYQFSLYARGGTNFTGPLSVYLEDESGRVCTDTFRIEKIGPAWDRFEHTFTADVTDSKARLVIIAGAKGSVWLDFVSLFPAKTWKGRENGLRSDIAEMIAGLHPGFVRFPGGCVVEAATTETAYNWKLTVGPVEQRQERWGPWNYRRTQGMGLFEYLQFCEDLGAAPLYVGFAGQTCIFRAPELVPLDQMDWVRDDFLDVIEYANGAASTRYGAMRAKVGHENPFGLKLIEIGNENQGPEFGRRYGFIHQAIKSKYPGITCFADLSWTGRDSLGGAGFDIEDQHYYNSPRWFATRFNEYDGRDRKQPPLYLGEVAVTTGDAGEYRGNMLAALSEGVFLMGCERNADVVSMVSYAPLLANVDGRTELTGAPPPWHAMIYFDGTRVFGTASYYLWKLFGVNRPDHCVETEVSFPDAKPPVVTGQIGLGTWADTAEFKDIKVEQNGKILYASDFTAEAKGWKTQGGSWSVEQGVYRQSQMGQGYTYFGNDTWTNYTLTLKARNVGGSEGFLIIFGRKGGDRYWWNLGGWGNTQDAIEFNQSPVGAAVPGKIERNRWYEVKIELAGSQIRCYLDGKLIHDATVPVVQKFFTVAGQDNASGDIIVKAINLGRETISASLNLEGVAKVSNTAEATVLECADLSENNSLSEPTKIAPEQEVIQIPGTKFAHEFPPRSLTVLRLKSR